MGFFNRNKNSLPSLDKPAEAPKKPITKDAKKRAVYTVILTVGLAFTYFLLQNIADKIYQRTNSLFLMYATIILYAGSLGVLLITYCIYNRGFALRNVTPDMLPDSLSSDKKLAMIEDAKARMKKSRWMLMLMIPIIVTFIIDACYQLIWLSMLEKYFI